MWRIYVYGMDLADEEYVMDGWQLYEETAKREYAEEIFRLLSEAHGSNVVLLNPDEDIEDIWEEVDYDDYRNSYNDYISSYILQSIQCQTIMPKEL